MNLNSSSFIRLDWILRDSAVLFSDFEDLLKFKRGDLISRGQPIQQNGWIIWSPLLCFSFRKLNDPNSLSFIRLDWSLHAWAVFFLYFADFLKFKKGNLISWGNQFFRMPELFGPPFCTSVLKSWTTQILLHSLDYIGFYMIQQYFCHILKIFSNSRRET